MNSKKIFFASLTFFFVSNIYGQHIGATFMDAEKQGIRISNLDSIYQPAIHVDSTKAVFKSGKENSNFDSAYIKMYRDLGKFLTANNFKWKIPAKVMNRIYYSADGTIDYFLYAFLDKNSKQDDKVSDDDKKEFNRLLNLFIKDYQLTVKANKKFTQCGKIFYTPK